MNQIVIGNFIKECRKELKMTQNELADKLSISFKTVSKWECGKGLPDLSLMLPLCNELHISVNELLSGCHIQKEKYIEKAEENLLDVFNERRKNKKRMIIVSLMGISCIITTILLMMLASFLDMEDWLRILIIIVGFAAMIIDCFALCFLDNDIGYFECKYCKKRFVPSIIDYIKGPHIFTTRMLKCPECGKISYCKKRLSRK